MESKASKSRVMSVYFISRHIAGQVVYYSGCLRMHALLWSICREFSKSTLRQPPQTTSPCETDGNIILKYKSNRAFLLKNELLFKTISLLTILVFICKFFMWPGKQVIDSNAQKTSVFHPLDSIFSNCATNVPKILDLKSSSEQIFFRKLSLGAPVPVKCVPC